MVRAGSLVEQWNVSQACVAADVVMIFQAANTGLIEESKPNGTYNTEKREYAVHEYSSMCSRRMNEAGKDKENINWS